MTPAIVLLSPVLPALEEKLQAAFTVYRWFEIDDAEAWLSAHGAEVRGVVTGANLGITNALMDKFPALGVVAINGVGFDRVDLQYAKKRSIRVSTTPNVLTDDVADLAVGLTIALLRKISTADAFVRAGHWSSGELPLARKVSGKRFGIVGLGHIGQAIASRLSGFGPVAYFARSKKGVPYTYFADLDALAHASDVLIVAVAGGASTRALINRQTLDALGADGYLVNIARGSVVDQQELIAALRDRRIAGAALDVFADEPRVPDELIEMSNVVLTPHIASATVEARQAMGDVVLANLDAYFSNLPMPSALV